MIVEEFAQCSVEDVQRWGDVDVDAFVELQSDGGGAAGRGGGGGRRVQRGPALRPLAPSLVRRDDGGRVQRRGARLVGPRLAARRPPLGAGAARVGRLRPLRRALLRRQLPRRHRLPGAAHLRRVPARGVGSAPRRVRRQPGRARRPFGAEARGGARAAQDAALRVRPSPPQGHIRAPLVQDRRLRQAVAYTFRGAEYYIRRKFGHFWEFAVGVKSIFRRFPIFRGALPGSETAGMFGN